MFLDDVVGFLKLIDGLGLGSLSALAGELLSSGVSSAGCIGLDPCLFDVALSFFHYLSPMHNCIPSFWISICYFLSLSD